MENSHRSRLLRSCALACACVTLVALPAQADVKTREKSQVKLEGGLGMMMRMFGGKAASEGVVSTNAVKGNRKATMSDTTGRIVDLAEQKVYELDIKDKSYRVVTFDELRRKLQEAQERAAKQSKETQQESAKQPSGKEVEFDFDVKETGQKKSIAGYDAREVVMTVTVREKGKTLDESGGLVLTADSWIGPDIPAMRELAEFEMKAWKAIAPEAPAVSAEQMAAVAAMYPMIAQAMERLNQEKVNMKGTPLAMTMTFDAVKSKVQMEEQSKNSNNSGGGLSGMLARKMMKKNAEDASKPRATIFTINNETQEIATSVSAADLEIPAGFKLKN
jgi:hypothetical protein